MSPLETWVTGHIMKIFSSSGSTVQIEHPVHLLRHWIWGSEWWQSGGGKPMHGNWILLPELRIKILWPPPSCSKPQGNDYNVWCLHFSKAKNDLAGYLPDWRAGYFSSLCSCGNWKLCSTLCGSLGGSLCSSKAKPQVTNRLKISRLICNMAKANSPSHCCQSPFPIPLFNFFSSSIRREIRKGDVSVTAHTEITLQQVWIIFKHWR